MEYLGLWDLIMDFSLQTDVEDVHIWRLSSFGQYSTKLAYEYLFQGAIQFRPWK